MDDFFELRLTTGFNVLSHIIWRVGIILMVLYSSSMVLIVPLKHRKAHKQGATSKVPYHLCTLM